MPEAAFKEGAECVQDMGKYHLISRRKFLSLIASGGAAALVASCSPKKLSAPLSEFQPKPDIACNQNLIKLITFARLPRWRGFNLLEKFKLDRSQWNRPFYESDLDIIADWGFDFIRLPMDYRIWTTLGQHYREAPLKDIDHVIEQACLRGIHVSLCLHRAPGYCVSPPREPLNLWRNDAGGQKARQLFADQWLMFAVRYRNIPPSALSFNLINEPPNISGETYARAVGPAIKAIRQISPDRLIIADGTNYGKRPVYELVPFQVAQSTRGYAPYSLSHYRASWISRSDQWAMPTWPLQKQGDKMSVLNKETLWARHVAPWEKFGSQQGIGIHVGEWGAYNKTPHEIVLKWMRDCLKNWQQAGMGWALWTLRGSFGPLDSHRADVVYENYKGHKLDRKMLELLKQF